MNQEVLDKVANRYGKNGGLASSSKKIREECSKEIEYIEHLNEVNGLPDMVLSSDDFTVSEKAVILAECIKHIQDFFTNFENMKSQTLLYHRGTKKITGDYIINNLGSKEEVEEYLYRKLEIYISSIFKRYIIIRISNSTSMPSKEKLERIKRIIEIGPDLTSKVFPLKDVNTEGNDIQQYSMMYGLYDFDDFAASYMLAPIILRLKDISAEEKGRFISNVLMEKDFEEDDELVVLEHYTSEISDRVLDVLSDDDKKVVGKILLRKLIIKKGKLKAKSSLNNFEALMSSMARTFDINLEEFIGETEIGYKRDRDALKDNDENVGSHPRRLIIYQEFLDFFRRCIEGIKSFGREDD